MTQKEEHPLEQDMVATTLDQNGKQDTGLAGSGGQVRKSKIKNWLKKLFFEEYELTIFFKGETKVLLDGARIESYAPKTYFVKKIKKISDKHFIFVDTYNNRHEIKTTDPVGYDLIKTY